MKKALTKSLSVILSVIMIFSCAVMASADENITIFVDLHGLEGNLRNISKTIPKSSTVEDLFNATDFVTLDENGAILSCTPYSTALIAPEGAKWQFAVEDEIQTCLPRDYVLTEDLVSVTVFLATEDAVYPIIETDENIHENGILKIFGKDKNGNVSPLVGASVTVTADDRKTKYTYLTDANGQIIVPEDCRGFCDHPTKVEKFNENGVPTVVFLNFADGYKISPDEDDIIIIGEEPTFFEKIASFFSGIIYEIKFFFTRIMAWITGKPFLPVTPIF